MWNRIETYINRHRDELDPETPSPEVWQRIQKDLQPVPSLWEKVAPVLKIAAAVVVACGVAFWWVNGDHQLPANSFADMGQLVHQETWHAQEMKYDQQIQALLDSLGGFAPGDHLIMDSAMSQISSLDQVLGDLHEQAEADGLSESMIKELDETYQGKLQLLRKLLDQLRANQPS